MADIGIADLLGIKKSIEENDIFNTISSSLLNFKPTTFGLIPGNQSAGVDPVAYSMPVGSQLASTFATALLGGLAHNYGKQQEAAQLKAVTDLLPSLINSPTSVNAPEGIDSNAFNLLKQTAIANKAEEDRKSGKEDKSLLFQLLAKAETGADRDKVLKVASELNMLPKDIDLSGGKVEPKTNSVAEKIANLPKALKDDAVKELASVAQQKQSLDFIDKKFDQAKNLTGAKAGLNAIPFVGIPTSEGQQLTGLGDSLVVQVDKILGKELNTDVRKRLLELTPKWYDTDKEIDIKKQNFKDLVNSLATSTPLLGSVSLPVAVPAPTPVSIPQSLALAEAKRRGLIP